jgi:alpha/beta superfamily hydrolase
MAKKIFISILIIMMVFSVLLLGCKDSAAPQTDEVQAAEEESTEKDTEDTDTEEPAEEIEADDAEAAEDVGEEDAEEVAEEAAGEEAEEDMAATEGEVTFMTEDGIELNGNIIGSGTKWIILSHMYPTDQTSWFDFAEILKEDGYSVLTYDFRGYGKSDGTQDVSQIVIDLRAAVAFVKQYEPEVLYLMGASMGGTASLVVAAEERIDGVISFSGPGEFEGVSATDVVGDIVAAKLFIASQGDGNAAQVATEMYDKSMEPKQIEILEGSSHGTFIFEEEPENAEIVKDIILFFLY